MESMGYTLKGRIAATVIGTGDIMHISLIDVNDIELKFSQETKNNAFSINLQVYSCMTMPLIQHFSSPKPAIEVRNLCTPIIRAISARLVPSPASGLLDHDYAVVFQSFVCEYRFYP